MSLFTIANFGIETEITFPRSTGRVWLRPTAFAGPKSLREGYLCFYLHLM